MVIDMADYEDDEEAAEALKEAYYEIADYGFDKANRKIIKAIEHLTGEPF